MEMRKKFVANKGQLVLILVNQEGIYRLSEMSSPERLVQFLRSFNDALSQEIEKAGGGVFWSVGDSMMAAWDVADWRSDKCNIANFARSLICMRQEILERLVPNGAAACGMKIALTQGECVFERAGNSFRNVFGLPVNKLMRIAGAYAPKSEAVVLFDETIKPLWQEWIPEDLGAGMFIVRT